MSRIEPHTAVAARGPRDRWRWGLAAFILVAYLGAFAVMPKDGFWVCDNGAKFIQVQGILRGHYRDYAIDWPGRAYDPTFHWSPLREPFGQVVNERLYVTFPPFFALVSSIPFRLLGYAGLYVLPLSAGLAALLAVWQLAGRLPAPQGTRPLAVLLAGLGTPLWFYSLTFWEHTPATALTLWGAVLLVGHPARPGVLGPVAAGICCGVAAWFREDTAVFAAGLVCVLLLYSRHRGRDALLFISAAALTWGPLGLFQWWALGHPLGNHLAPHNPFAAGLAEYWQGRCAVILNLLVKVHQTLWLSWLISGVGLLAWVVNPRVPARWFRWLVPAVAGLAGAGVVIVGMGYLRAPSPMWWMIEANGLFAGSTVLFLAFVRTKPATHPARSGEPDTAHGTVDRMLWVLVSLWVLLYVLIAPPGITRGIHWACRYLLPVYPLLGVLAAGTIARWWQRAGRAPVSRVVVVSALVLTGAAQVYALHLLRCRKAFVRTLNKAVAQRPEQVVISNVWNIPMDLAPSFFEKAMFVPRGGRDALDLVRELRAAGHERALLVGLYDRRLALPADGLLLCDPPLNFSPLVIGSVALDE